jgi:hypothetical protein
MTPPRLWRTGGVESLNTNFFPGAGKGAER